MKTTFAVLALLLSFNSFAIDLECDFSLPTPPGYNIMFKYILIQSQTNPSGTKFFLQKGSRLENNNFVTTSPERSAKKAHFKEGFTFEIKKIGQVQEGPFDFADYEAIVTIDGSNEVLKQKLVCNGQD